MTTIFLAPSSAVNDHVLEPSPYEPRQRYWRILAKRAVMATGAEERPSCLVEMMCRGDDSQRITHLCQSLCSGGGQIDCGVYQQ
jgi:hypothetical protein